MKVMSKAVNEIKEEKKRGGGKRPHIHRQTDTLISVIFNSYFQFFLYSGPSGERIRPAMGPKGIVGKKIVRSYVEQWMSMYSKAECQLHGIRI